MLPSGRTLETEEFLLFCFVLAGCTIVLFFSGLHALPTLTTARVAAWLLVQATLLRKQPACRWCGTTSVNRRRSSLGSSHLERSAIPTAVRSSLKRQ
jgi:hypothetical protein